MLVNYDLYRSILRAATLRWSSTKAWDRGQNFLRAIRGASRAKLTQGAALKRSGTSLSLAKKLLLRTCYPLRLASLP